MLGRFCSIPLRDSAECCASAQLRYFAQQINPAPFDEAFDLSNSAPEIAGVAGPPTAIERRVSTDVSFKPVEDGKKFLGDKFLLEQFLKSIQESDSQGRVAEEAVLDAVPARDAR